MRAVLTVPVVLAALSLVACEDAGDRADLPPADGAPAAPADSTPLASNGCAIVAEGDIEQAVGFDVVLNDNATDNCIATPADGSASAPTVDFRIEPRTNAFDYFSAQPDASPVLALGDRAVWATLNETTGFLVVVTGTRAVVVGIGKADGVNDHSRRQAEAVARILVAGVESRE